MEPYPSNTFDNSEYDAQSLPYIPYGTGNENSSQLYNVETGTNSNAVSQSPPPPSEKPPVYGSYAAFPNTAAQPAGSGYPAAPTDVARPRKKWRAWLLVGLIVVLFFVFAGSAYELTAYFNRSTPSKTLDAFCLALQNGDYQTAYNQFTPTMQTNFTESQFASLLSGDSVADCTHGSVSDSGTTVSTDLHLYHSKSKLTNNDIVTISKDTRGQWKISNLQST